MRHRTARTDVRDAEAVGSPIPGTRLVVNAGLRFIGVLIGSFAAIIIVVVWPNFGKSPKIPGEGIFR